MSLDAEEWTQLQLQLYEVSHKGVGKISKGDRSRRLDLGFRAVKLGGGVRV